MSITPAVCLSVFVTRTETELDEALDCDIARAGALLASDEYIAQRAPGTPWVSASRVPRMCCRTVARLRDQTLCADQRHHAAALAT